MTLNSSLRVLFTDFDGVWHPYGSAPEQWFLHAPFFYSLLGQFMPLRLVVHSSWRMMHSDEEIRDFLFHPHRPDLQDRLLGATTRGISSRWESIEQYLKDHPGVNYRILDDEPKKFPSYVVESPQFITCNSRTGVDELARQRLMKWLWF